MDNTSKHFYKFEKMLDEFKGKLNTNSGVELGNPDEDIDLSIKRYYKTYLKTNLDNLINDYLTGIIWVVNYYWNDEILLDWHYEHSKAPFMTDIYKYLSKKDNQYIIKLEDTMKKKFPLSDLNKFFTPIEQLLYITPFDIKVLKKTGYDKDLDMFKGILSSNQIDKLKKFIIGTDKIKDLKNFYFSISDYVDTVLEKEKNDLIDCRDIPYVNKCSLKGLKYANKIKTTKFIDEFRKLLPN